MRRTVRSILACIGLVLSFSLTGCAKERVPVEKVEEENPVESVSEETVSGKETEGSKSIVVYFSLAGEQYNVGVIEEGNTAILAGMIAEETGADMFAIQAEDPYPLTYSGLLDVAKEEQRRQARPAYTADVENFEDYDTVYIGYPIWWGDMPMIVYTFLESHDFTGKTVVPFVTHGGSGFAGTEKTIASLIGATMIKGLAIPGETAQNDRETSRTQVKEWLRENGLSN